MKGTESGLPLLVLPCVFLPLTFYEILQSVSLSTILLTCTKNKKISTIKCFCDILAIITNASIDLTRIKSV